MPIAVQVLWVVSDSCWIGRGREFNVVRGGMLILLEIFAAEYPSRPEADKRPKEMAQAYGGRGRITLESCLPLMHIIMGGRREEKSAKW